MSTVIEHGVVVPKPTVKAVACCTESSRTHTCAHVVENVKKRERNMAFRENAHIMYSTQQLNISVADKRDKTREDYSGSPPAPPHTLYTV